MRCGREGLALGGLSVGEPIPAMHATLAEIAPESTATQAAARIGGRNQTPTFTSFPTAPPPELTA